MSDTIKYRSWKSAATPACPCEMFRMSTPHYSCDLHQSLRRLAANLAIGAALCRAHKLGTHCGSTWAAGSDVHGWTPGCRRSAP